MATDMRAARAQRLAEEKTRKYGAKAAIAGRPTFAPAPVYSTGSLTLDYVLGSGGWPGNAFVEVFGPPEIGKTTIFGFGVLRSVQAAGGITATIATEPDFDEVWMEANGVNPDHNVVFRPDTGEEAWELLRDLVYEREVDYVLWDSIANTNSAKEQNSEKPQAFGNAAMNAWGLRNVATRAWKNQVGVMFINQIRDDAKSPVPGTVKSTGGHAVAHAMRIRIQVKPGAERFMVKVPSAQSGKGSEDLMVGREIRAVIQKNKTAQRLAGMGVFDYYYVETDDLPFGVDKAKDVYNVAKMAGVIEGSGWLKHPTFPDGKINGAPKTQAYLAEHPEAVEVIWKECEEVMRKRERELAAKKKSLKTQAS